MRWLREKRVCREGCCWGTVSWRKRRVASAVNVASIAAKYAGVEKECWERIPPRAGPNIKPRPKAAPKIPIPRARFLALVRSAT